MIGWISLITPVLARHAAHVGVGARVVADLSQSRCAA
jgi:hypothetical protein